MTAVRCQGLLPEKATRKHLGLAHLVTSSEQQSSGLHTCAHSSLDTI